MAVLVVKLGSSTLVDPSGELRHDGPKAARAGLNREGPGGEPVSEGDVGRLARAVQVGGEVVVANGAEFRIDRMVLVTERCVLEADGVA